MTKAPLALISLLTLTAGWLAGQSAGFEKKDWKRVARVTVSGGDRYGLIRVDAPTWRASEASLRDLRLRDNREREVPYVVRDKAGAMDTESELRPLLYDRVVTPQGNLQFLLDFGESAPMHNAMRLRWSDRNFRRRMRIESSANGRNWDLVKETTLLDFDEDGQVFRTEDIEYPATARRYLRIAIENWKNPGALISVISRFAQAKQDEWLDLGQVPFEAARDPQSPGAQVVEVSLPFAAPERMRLRFETSGEEFVRTVEVKTELPGQRWVVSCSGTIVRAGDTDRPWLECSTVLTRKLRALIRNNNNAELTIRSVHVLAPAREIVFSLQGAASYRLFAGNAQARPPVYDLDAVLRATPVIDPRPATLSKWQDNPDYEAPGEPASEKAKGWLTGLLVAILIGIALTARFLLRMATRKRRRYV